MSYDSTQDTKNHISMVRDNIARMNGILYKRAFMHDKSKLEYPEKEAYDKATPVLRHLEYGTEEYKKAIREYLGEAVLHHYANNDHHAEHYSRGVYDMNFFSLLEMLANWKAANDRSGTKFKDTLKINIERFNIDEWLATIIYNTVKELGWA